MQGTIVNFRGGRHTQKCNQMIIVAEGVKNKSEADKLVGKTVVWKNPVGKQKKEIKGKITNTHGNKGATRVLFEKGLPGQAISTKVVIE